MKKMLLLLVSLIFAFNIAADRINDSIATIRELDKRIKELARDEEKYKSKLEKLEDKSGFFANRRKRSYLKDLNEIQKKLNRVKTQREQNLKQLKIMLRNKIAEIRSEIFEKIKDKSTPEIIDLQKRYIELKQHYDFYFDEKIDIIIYKNEPEDIKKMKLKMVKKRMSDYKVYIENNRKILDEFREQLDFLEDFNIDSFKEDTINDEYMEFLSKSIKYLEKDIEEKQKVLEFYREQLQISEEGDENETSD